MSLNIEYYECNPRMSGFNVTLLLAGDQHVKDEGATLTFMEIKLVVSLCLRIKGSSRTLVPRLRSHSLSYEIVMIKIVISLYFLLL